MLDLMILIFLIGRSSRVVGLVSMARITFIFFTMFLNMMCLLFNYGVVVVVIKNCELFVFGLVLVIDSIFGLMCGIANVSFSNLSS